MADAPPAEDPLASPLEGAPTQVEGAQVEGAQVEDAQVKDAQVKDAHAAGAQVEDAHAEGAQAEGTPEAPAAPPHEAQPGASVRTPLLSYDEFLQVAGLDALIERYRASGVEGDREAVLVHVQQDWYLAAIAHAREIERVPERFEPDCGELDGVTVRVWGLFHGMWGGADAEYKEFVRAPLRELGEVLFENGVGYYYKPKRKITVPDFAVIFPLGSIRHGFYVGLRFPLLMKELIWEFLSLGHGFDPAEPYVLSPSYHSLPIEARRGVEEQPPLPTRLMVEYELGNWERAGALGAWREPFAIVPRSMFMAAFAYGYAQSRKLSQVDMVVGDLHTGEVLHFLADPPREHALWRLGEAYGRLSDGRRILKTALLKIGHLGLAASIGAPLMIGTLLLLWWLFLQAKAAIA